MRNAHRNFSRAVDGLALLVGLIAAPAPPAPAQVNVLTWHNDNARTGQNLNEQLLSPGNVKRGSFGLRFSQPVDGIITAQPLYVSGVEIAGRGRHNIVCSAPDRVDRTVGVSGPIESRCQLRFNGEITSCLDRCSIVQTLDDPVLVIPLAKLHQGGSEFGQVAEASNP
jgi:hypothetical protein